MDAVAKFETKVDQESFYFGLVFNGHTFYQLSLQIVSKIHPANKNLRLKLHETANKNLNNDYN